MRDREYTVSEFLTLLVIRRGDYREALRFRWRATRIRPRSLLGRSVVDFTGLLIGHALGLKRYSWSVFRRRKAFLTPGEA